MKDEIFERRRQKLQEDVETAVLALLSYVGDAEAGSWPLLDGRVISVAIRPGSEINGNS